MTDKMAVLQFVKNYINDNGWAPSVREISASVGSNSTGTANYFLGQLESDGYIVRAKRTARAITITQDGNTALYNWLSGGSGAGNNPN